MFAATFLPLILGVCDLSGALAGPEGWDRPAEAFVSAYQADGFRFADQKREIVNCLRRGGSVWHGLEVWETRLYYAEGRLSRVELSLYNRGDDRSGDAVTASELQDLLARAAAAAEPGGKIGGNPEMTKLKSGGYQYSKSFSKGPYDVRLLWGVDSLKQKTQTADYVRAVLTPKGAGGSSGVRAAAGVSRLKVRANVRRNAEGDVWIEGVPMVDQGQKGYCACAVTERVLRYYGSDVDEHQIAQMAGSSAQRGTGVEEMIQAVRTLGQKCKLGFRSIVSMSGSVKDIEKEVEKYNKAAKSMKAPQIDMRSCMRGHTIMVNQIRDQMRPDVVMKMRVKDARYGKFLSGVRSQVDEGVPVFWGVTLGLFPERGLPQTRGGHMRLIIGYNAKTHEILYSDTWGAGHELKRMPEDQAFAITHDAFLLKPR